MPVALPQIVMDRVDKPRKISFKGVTDLVTDTDQASEEVILASLKAAFPDHAILGEEGGVSGKVNSPNVRYLEVLFSVLNEEEHIFIIQKCATRG